MVPFRNHLKSLSDAYLKFLIHRDESVIKPFLSLNFLTRQKAFTQLRLIKNLPSIINYGFGPEASLWQDYVLTKENNVTSLSPFQFEVHYRNGMNPLIAETMTITIQTLFLENQRWVIESVISEADHHLLINYLSDKKQLAE